MQSVSRLPLRIIDVQELVKKIEPASWTKSSDGLALAVFVGIAGGLFGKLLSESKSISNRTVEVVSENTLNLNLIPLIAITGFIATYLILYSWDKKKEDNAVIVKNILCGNPFKYIHPDTYQTISHIYRELPLNVNTLNPHIIVEREMKESEILKELYNQIMDERARHKFDFGQLSRKINDDRYIEHFLISKLAIDSCLPIGKFAKKNKLKTLALECEKFYKENAYKIYLSNW